MENEGVLHLCRAQWLLLLLLFVMSSPHVDACSPPLEWQPPMTLTEKILFSNELLYGRVLHTYTEEHGYGSKSAYTAEMEVYCVLKGRRPDHIVNITRAGYIPGHCGSSNLTVGNDYVVRASYIDDDYDHGVYRIELSEIDVTEDNLRQITNVCGLQRVYPNGVEESTASVKCPVPAPPGQCMTIDDVRRGRAVISSCATLSLISATVAASLTVTLCHCRRVLFVF